VKAKAQAIFTVIVLTFFCAGCGTVGTGFDPNSNRVYGGVRQDCHLIVHPDFPTEPIFFVVDVPFSFAADTIFLPFDLYHLTEMPPSPDPLKDWKSWSRWDEEPHPASYGFHGTILVERARPVTHSPLDKAVTDDYQNFIKKLKFRHGPESKDFGAYGGSIVFFEDGTGQHAVKIVIPCDNLDDSVTYILIYDKSDVRRNVIKYKYFKPPSFG
jgi:uncharacterized protein YceK